MSVLIITRNDVEVYVLKKQIKDLKPTRLKNTNWMQQHSYTLNSYVFVVCNKEGQIKFSHPSQKYKIHHIGKSDLKGEEIIDKVEEVKVEEIKVEELLYEDYYTFAIVDYLEETMFE